MVTNNQIFQELRGYLGNQNILLAGQNYKYTQWEIDEFVKCSKDIHHFIKNYMKVVHIDKGLVPFDLYPYQVKIVDTMVKERFVIGKLPRQSGKTTMTVAYLLWYALFNPNSNIAILAHRANTARELFGKLRLAYEHLPKFLQAGIAPGGWNKGSIRLGNGSQIKADATSSGSIRGEAYNIIFLDEFAFVKNNMAEEFINSVYPTISSGKTSKVIIFSTPKGTNHFYEMWEEAVKGESGFVPVYINWDEVPGRDEKWKKEQIAKIGKRSWNQEFECQFIGSSTSLLEPEFMQEMWEKWKNNKPIIEHAGFKIYEQPVKGHKYVICVDVSRGLGLDYHAFTIIDVTNLPYVLIGTFHDNKLYPTILPNVVAKTAEEYNNAHILVEISDIGQQVADMLIGDLDCDNVIRVASKPGVGQTIGFGFAGKVANGIKTSTSTKRVGCADLKTLIESKNLIVQDPETIKEFFTFVSQNQSYGAEIGYHDDLVMCLVLFGWLSHQRYFREEAHDIRELIEKQQEELLDSTLTPFGIIDDGTGDYSYDYDKGIGITETRF
jgi:Terminase large subunit, T4likevirus-type, N-terminal/Terminase RNaseH-like domain